MQRDSRIAGCIFVLLTAVLFLLAGCAAPAGKEDGGDIVAIDCVAVLPVTPLQEASLSGQDMAALQQGSAYATRVMAGELANNPKVQLVGGDEEMLDVTGSRERLERLVAIGERSGCQAVLLTSMQRFHQRQGGEMAVESPASAAFTMTLIQLPSGAVLWTGDYTETQQSFLANILSGKMGQRGFRWITVEELVRQALEERLAACPYLK